MSFFTQNIGPLPVWGWLVAIIGGVVLFFVIRRSTSGTSGATTGSPTAATTSPLNPTADPQIDPNTGVPYALEEAIDPATGTPYYYQTNYGANNMGQAGGTSGGPTQPPSGPPAPGPGSNSTSIQIPETGGASLNNIINYFYGTTTDTQRDAILPSIIQANPSLAGATGATIPPKGAVLTLPQVTTGGNTYTPKIPAAKAA